jgi:hypothetical protein
MSKILFIRTKNAAVREVLAALALKTQKKVDSYSLRNVNNDNYPYFVTDDNFGKGCGFSRNDFYECDSQEVSLEEMINWLAGKFFGPVTIKLNDECSAVIQGNGEVQVGCQTFSADTIIYLANEVKKVLQS